MNCCAVAIVVRDKEWLRQPAPAVHRVSAVHGPIVVVKDEIRRAEVRDREGCLVASKHHRGLLATTNATR